jgi:hypothetical protein
MGGVTARVIIIVLGVGGLAFLWVSTPNRCQDIVIGGALVMARCR